MKNYNGMSYRHFKDIFKSFFLFSDFLIIALCGSIFNSAKLDSFFINNYISIFIIGLIISTIWFSTTHYSNLFEELQADDLSIPIIKATKAFIVMVSIIILFNYIFGNEIVKKRNIVYFSFIFFFLWIIKYLLLEYFRFLLIKKYNLYNRILLIGDNIEITSIEGDYQQNSGRNKYLLFEDIFNSEYLTRDKKNNIDYFVCILSAENIDEIIANHNYQGYLSINQIKNICEINNIRLHILYDHIPNIQNIDAIETINCIPTIAHHSIPLNNIQNKLLKRIFDISFSLCCLLLLTPAILMIIVVHKLLMGGATLFIQERIGYRNKRFQFIKFRTMNETNTNDMDFKPVEKNDSRITKFGALLRKSNLDEIPQFINVIKGNMSVIGPRPHAVLYHEKYEMLVNDINMRHRVKPGLTGWAQIHGLRGDSVNQAENKRRILKRIEFDNWYIENWSIWLDIRIVIQTIWQMFKLDTMGY